MDKPKKSNINTRESTYELDNYTDATNETLDIIIETRLEVGGFWLHQAEKITNVSNTIDKLNADGLLNEFIEELNNDLDDFTEGNKSKENYKIKVLDLLDQDEFNTYINELITFNASPDYNRDTLENLMKWTESITNRTTEDLLWAIKNYHEDYHRAFDLSKLKKEIDKAYNMFIHTAKGSLFQNLK